MGKFRSKLKRHTKGKTWGKGQSATSNPEQMKHRLKAKTRFFQANLKLAPDNAAATPNGLTMEAVQRHEQRQAYNAGTTTVNDVAGSFKSFSIADEDEEFDERMSESQPGTFKTFKTFASNYSSCSNMSFKKLLYGFRVTSDLHKEMLAILTALTEIIKERGGTESSTEYFLLLMEQIEAAKEEKDTIAGVALLSMGIKSVPQPVLRKRFDQTATTLMTLLQRFAESINQTLIKSVIGCLSVLLRAQDYVTWTYSSTNQYIDALLSFSIHSKPKIRKAAQHAVVSIVHGSSFMLPQKTDAQEGEELPTVPVVNGVKYHPASNRVTKFCLAQFKPEILANQQTTVLHTLTLLKDTLSRFKTEDIRTVCEHLLSIMTAANVLIRTNCFHALHALFLTRTTNLNGQLCAKLLAAIHEYRPDRNDVRQTLAWITVLKEGHVHLASLELNLCINSLPRLIEVCTTDLWFSDHVELIVGVSNSIKELLHECVTPACASLMMANVYRAPISRIIALIDKVLNAPFGEVAKYVILTFSAVFEACGAYFSKELAPSLLTLAKRYDTQSTLRIQIEHSIIGAIKSMGPEAVLQSIPLSNANGIILEKSWLLPLLREGATGATLQFFKDTILPLALDCNMKWHKYAAEKQVAMSHTYELLACQLWGLFPGFCRQPRDPENLSLIGPTLGNALDNNPEFRAPIFDGLAELLENEQNSESQVVLGRYAKNFLPRLFNIYTQKPNGTYEADLRKRALEIIKLYVAKTPVDVQLELFEAAKSQLTTTALCTFEYDAFFDINAALVMHQTAEQIRVFFETFIVPVLKNEKSKLVSKDEQKLKKQQRKTYELLRDIMTSELASCQKFARKNSIAIQKLLLDAFATSCQICQAARLHCLKILIENRASLNYNDKIVMKTIPEAVLNYRDLSTRKENIAEEIIKLIAKLYHEAGKINDFVDILTAGFTGDESLITNTILAFRAVLQHQGKYLTVSTLEFVLQQVSVFLVQRSRPQAEASVAFLITFIKVMPTPLVANHLESIMRSLSAMTKDTKRYCRIQIGYFLKKLCKRFTADELAKFVPGDDELTHRRIKKIRKQMRRETRKKLAEEEQKDDDDDSDAELASGLEKKSITIDDILADSDSDLPEEMEADDEKPTGKAKNNKSKKERSTYIQEDPDDIVDLADIKSIGNVLTNRPNLAGSTKQSKSNEKDKNRGFKTAEDGRLIISDKALRGVSSDEDDDDDDDDDSGSVNGEKTIKRGLEEDSSDEEELPTAGSSKRKVRKATDTMSMRSGKTHESRYTTGGKGIHRPIGASSDAVSMKSGYSAKTMQSVKSSHAGTEYGTKKAKGDMKKRGKLDPYAYIPLTRNTLNKRKRAVNSRNFKSVVGGGRKSGKVGKNYKP